MSATPYVLEIEDGKPSTPATRRSSWSVRRWYPNYQTRSVKNLKCDLDLRIVILLLMIPFVVVGIIGWAQPEAERLQRQLKFAPERDASLKLVDQSDNELVPLLPDYPVCEAQRTFVWIQPRTAKGWSNPFNLYDVNGTDPEFLYAVRGPSRYSFAFKAQSETTSEYPLTLQEKVWTWASQYNVLVDNVQVASIKKSTLTLRDTYTFSLDDESAKYLIKVDTWLQLYWMRNQNEEIVAKISYHGGFYTSEYLQMQIAPGMDPAIVWVCAVSIFNELIKAAQHERSSKSSYYYSSSSGKK